METAEKNMELLAPAGSMESLVAAVQAGADAVYFGGGAFNARRLAKNFDGDELRQAVEYLRLHGVKSYITFNTLMFDRELNEALDYAAFLYGIGVDAVIVQDMGLVSILRRELPGLTLHASTQMGIHTPEGAKLMLSLGMERVVLSREVPLAAIPAIAAVGAEVEAFAQGALCMSFSGGCLYSSMAGERSGNRGTCAQPCRKRISIAGAPGGTDYQLSLSDLCMIEHLSDMERAGVCCIKLEGRMKRPEYVAAVTRAYRLALDGGDWHDAMDTADKLFFRGVRAGYYYGDGGVTGCVAQSTPDNAAIKAAQNYFAGENRTTGASLSLTLHAGEAAQLRVTCRGKTVTVCGETAQQAQTPAGERYAEQLKKLGGTVFHADKVSVDAPDGFLPISAVNALRREAVQRMTEELSRLGRETPKVELPSLAPRSGEPFRLLARVRTEEQARAAYDAGADWIALYPAEYGREALETLQYIRENRKLLLALPAVMISEGERRRVRELMDSGIIDGGIAENIGQFELMEHLPIRIAGPRLNALNSYAVNALVDLGFDRVILSEELTKPQLRDILSSAGGGVRIYGYTELMQLMHCPNREYSGCTGCKADVRNTPAAVMTDEAGRRFMLCNVKQQGGCLVRLLNSAVSDITDVYRSVKPGLAELAFYYETPEQVKSALRRALMPEDERTALEPGSTRGHWARAVE